MPEPVDAEELVALGRRAGLHAVGIARAVPFEQTRAALEQRKAAGLHGGMAFTYRNPARSTDPGGLVRGAQAIVVGARRYPSHEPPAPDHPSGRVARYARHDHYAPLRAALRAMAQSLKAAGWKAVVFADDNSLVDREAAYRAGLGWYGKNANLLLAGQGSWFVLGSVVTDAPLPPSPAPVADGCGSCRRCIDACPTGAIVAPGVVDARRCLAWLVQQPGVFPRQHRTALGDRLYGCDDCQEVCPPNRRLEAPAGAAGAVGGDAGEAPGGAEGAGASGAAWVDLLELLAATDDELLARHGRWYLAGRDPRWLRRNALVVLGNRARTGGPQGGPGAAVEEALARYLLGPDPLLRAHALWAAAQLGLAPLVTLAADDQHPLVADERAALQPA